MSQKTGKIRNTIDQFYTTPIVADMCMDALLKYKFDGQMVEPTAGKGVFLTRVPDVLAFDIDPKHPRVQQADIFTRTLPQKCVVFGNPPFGRQGSIAKKIIQHVSKFALVIAFILPRSFTKPSMYSCFPLHFHCIETFDLPFNSFEVNDKPYNVPCVFQIWVCKESPRPTILKIHPFGFTFVKETDAPHIAFRRVGVNAGKCSLFKNQSKQSHYFIRVSDETKISSLCSDSQTHIFPTNTTGPRSLSKQEATEFLNTRVG